MRSAYATLPLLALVTGGAYLFGGSPSVPLLVVFGFALAVVDTAFGMGYGTLATPILLIAGFSPLAIVPAVLLSQAVATGFATAFHLKNGNVDLFDLKGTDARISGAIIVFGIVGVVTAVALAINLPAVYVETYIGLLVVAMGFLLIAKPRVGFSWPKVIAISVVNGFDKAISGGGFGPVAVGGLLTLGRSMRNAVGIAVFTATVVNFAGVVLYLLFNAVGPVGVSLMVTLSVGGVIGSAIGPRITSRLNARAHLSGLALLMMAVGALSLLTTVVKI